MSEDSAWLDAAVLKGRAASPTVTDAVANTLTELLGGAFQKQRLSNKQLEGNAQELLQAMKSPPPSESAG